MTSMADEILERIERRMEQFDTTVQWMMEQMAAITARNEASWLEWRTSSGTGVISWQTPTPF